ncbi:DHA2 family efflux MFS transporter permease subunit [Streptomyces sp. NPDC087420]|uniref:DHA2 family efflux MFS transporter permease subunit n=1 Tax=Streptomyces sp. NPDC087420 TaxID=3365785 RepID=UPI003835C234
MSSLPVDTGGAGAQVNRGLVMAVLGGCFLVVMMDNTILNVALQTLQTELGASNAELQWALDSYILFYAALMFSAGILADAFGRRRVLLIGLVVFGVASGFAAWADTPDQLIFWRAVMGVGGAVVPPATLAVINDIFPREERGKAIGIWSALGGLSIALGPIIGGFLLNHFWWGSVFLINVPVVVGCAVLLLLILPESRAAAKPQLDLPGVLLSIVGIGALIYGVIRGGDTNHWTSPEVLGSILGGVALLALFIRFESRAALPALDVKLLRNKAFAAGTASLALSFFALTGGTFLMVFYIQGVRGYSPLELGLILLPVAVGTVVSATQSNTLAGKFGPKATVTGGLLLLALAFTWQAWVKADTALWLFEINLGLSGLGLGLVMGTSTTVTMAVVAPEKAGVGAAVNNTLRQVGAALGVAVLGSVLSVRYRDELGAATDVLPPDLRESASESLGGTLTVAQRIQESGTAGSAPVKEALPHLLGAAQDSYMAAMHFSFAIAASALAVAAVVAAVWLPGRAGDSAAGETEGPGKPVRKPVREENTPAT